MLCSVTRSKLSYQYQFFLFSSRKKAVLAVEGVLSFRLFAWPLYKMGHLHLSLCRRCSYLPADISWQVSWASRRWCLLIRFSPHFLFLDTLPSSGVCNGLLRLFMKTVELCKNLGADNCPFEELDYVVTKLQRPDL